MAVTTWQEIEKNYVVVGYGVLIPVLTASAGSNANFPVQNLRDPARWKKWVSAASGAQTLTVDFGGNAGINAVAFANTNRNVGQWGTTKLQKSSNGTSWTDVVTIAPGGSVADDEDYFASFSTDMKRYWRLDFGSPTAPPQIGVWCLGRIFAYQDPDRDGMEYEWDYGLREIIGESGSKFVEKTRRRIVRFRMLRTGLDRYNNGPNYSKFQDFMTIHESQATGTLNLAFGSFMPFFFCPRPDGVYTFADQGRAYYVRFQSIVSAKERFIDRFEQTIVLEEDP